MTDQLPADIAEAIEDFEACLEGTARGYAAGDHATVRAALDAVILKHLCKPRQTSDLRVFVVAERDGSDAAEDDIWTLSEDPNAAGWQTDSGCPGYGLTKAKAEAYAAAINRASATDLGRSALAEEGGGR